METDPILLTYLVSEKRDIKRPIINAIYMSACPFEDTVIYPIQFSDFFFLCFLLEKRAKKE